MRRTATSGRVSRASALAAGALGVMLTVGGGLPALANPTDPVPATPAAAAPVAITPPATEAAAPLASAAPLADASPAVAAAYARLRDPAFAGRYGKDDIEAAITLYGARKDPLWVGAAGLNERGSAVVAEIAKAADWGLDAGAFLLPDAAAPLATPDALGATEAQVTLAALTYARHARGGRTRPLSISQMLDLTPPVRDPKIVLSEIETASAPAAYLTGLHPRHEQFQRLRAELVKRQGPVAPAPPRDDALLVKLPPDGATIKPGSLHADIALLRKRLKLPAEFAGRETLFDDRLADAIKAFQADKGLKVNGQLNKRTRSALNKEGEANKPDQSRDTQRLIVNMERWRWMPEDLGRVHVLNNVPEYITRTYKDGKVIFQEKIVVGQPSWPTPSFSAEMKTIVFNPSWGVPDGIKAKELKPRLERAGGGGFFDQLFGGGGGGAAVIKAYGFTAYRNGKPVDPNSVDWANADLRAYSFIQPPGAQNPLGFVKFMFPNTHDVYMHDTTQRSLFSEARRPFSHGCIRVNNPGRFAEVLMAEDKGWGADRVVAARRSSETVELTNHIWVHNVYLTAWVQDDGRVVNFGDVYGLDSRVSQAIGGRALRSIEPPVDDLETASIADQDPAADETPKQKKKNGQALKKASSKSQTMPGSFSEAMSGLVSN